MDTKLAKARDLIRQHPYLIWYSKNYDGFDEKVIVEAVLNYGSWQITQKLFSILGLPRTAQTFNELNSQKRCNLHPLARNYFSLYFTHYAYRNLN